MTSNNDKKYLSQAVQLAQNKSADGKNGPFGAVITQEDEIISKGWNQVVQNQDPTAHAEIIALRKACEELDRHDLSNCVIYSSCEPCPMCLSAIYWARLKKVVFAADKHEAAQIGFDDRNILNELGKNWEDRELEMKQIKLESAKNVFEKWKNNPNKIMY